MAAVLEGSPFVVLVTDVTGDIDAGGSHDKSNWLIPGWVLLGGWPFRLPKGRGSAGESEDEGGRATAAEAATVTSVGGDTFLHYPLVKVYITMDKSPCYSQVNPLILWPFSLADCWFTSVHPIC